MPASDWLDPSVVMYFIRHYGGTNEAAVAAMQLPAYAEEITRQTGARLETTNDGLLYPKFFSDRERSFWKLVEGAVGPNSQEPEPKGEPGRPEIRITQATLFDLFRAGLERARSTKKRRQPSYDKIADEHALKRTWTTPIVRWAESHQREAREAIVSSKTPERFSTLIRD